MFQNVFQINVRVLLLYRIMSAVSISAELHEPPVNVISTITRLSFGVTWCLKKTKDSSMLSNCWNVVKIVSFFETVQEFSFNAFV